MQHCKSAGLSALVMLGVSGACLLTPTLARADYKLRPGDVLSFTVVGMPDLATKATIDGDGNVSLPLAGDLKVAGSNVADAKAKLRMILPAKQVNAHLADGRQIPTIIAPDQINLSIAEYRPVYVDGDVAKAGAVAFLPGLTVRQAVALAGGLGPSRTKADDPVAQTVDLTGQYNDLSVTLARTQVRVVRLQAEADGRREFDPKFVPSLPVSQKLRDDIISAEQQLMAARVLDYEKERAYLTAASKREAQRASILNQQEAKDGEGVKIDEADLARLDELFRKGAVALPTMSEARRTVLQSSTRALQTTAALASVQRDQGEFDRRYDRINDTRRTEILGELAEATVKLASTRAEMQAVTTKLRYAGMLKPQVAPGLDQVRISIIRNSDGISKPVVADLDTDLQPGDAVQIVLPESESTAVGQ